MLNDAIPTRSLDTIRAAIATAVAPGHFFVSGALHLAWRHLPTEELPWENFHGRLLDATQTRQRRTFESWNIHVLDGDAVVAEPLLSLKLDAAVGNVYVTRGIKSYAWEAYDSGDNVILSRPVEKWLRELTAVVELSRLRDAAALREELAGRLRQAVLGVSRLPLTSVEAPLPAFSLGELAYFHQPSAADSSTPMSSWMELLERGPQATSAPAEQARLLECLLRGTPDAALPTVASAFAERWHRSRESLPALLLLVFNEAALSPYTSFVDRALAFARLLEDRQLLSAAGHADFLARLLRLVARHLTAFDLVKFHHRGA
ncbi:MAG: hypothetical protein JNM56_40685, partial [Planctomycetia bacterium]|nr:hypothetical protein [Planctomycetia bacterium]